MLRLEILKDLIDNLNGIKTPCSDLHIFREEYPGNLHSEETNYLLNLYRDWV